MTSTLFSRITSTRYIFLFSGLAFILWSLVTSIAPKSSALSALFQVDLDQSLADTITHPADAMDAIRPQNRSQLGVARAHVYVVSLADRQDRREQMAYLRAIQDVEWTVVDAVPSHAPVVQRIFDRVVIWRADSDVEGKRMSDKVGTTGFRWPEGIDAFAVSGGPLGRFGSDTWGEASGGKRNAKSGTGKTAPVPTVPCATEDDVIPTSANAAGGVVPGWMTLSLAKIACWHSHVSVVRQFVEASRPPRGDDGEDGEDVAIVLEDDIDMERDISARLAQLWTFLPAGWDIVFLGHCWSNESHHPALTSLPHANLHPSYHPKCTHAYALSRPGARRLLQHLRHPPFAYSRALDQAYAWLVRSGRLRGYSIVPSLVVQRKSGKSDIWVGPGSEWREGLRDGVFGGVAG